MIAPRDDSARIVRGLEIAATWRLDRQGSAWVVKEPGSGRQYQVEPAEPSCTCGECVPLSGATCPHLIAVRLVIATTEGPNAQPLRLPIAYRLLRYRQAADHPCPAETLERLEQQQAELVEKLTQLAEQFDRRAEQPAREYVTIKEAAKITGLGEGRVRRAVYHSELRASNLGSSAQPCWRIARTDLNAWMERCSQSPQPRRSPLQELIDQHMPKLRRRSS